MRRRHGVYFTPPEVVSAQVRLVDAVLRQRLGCADGLADPRVLIVDPACGTGAYPLAILELAGDVRARMRLFESLPGPAAVARERGLPVVERDALTWALDEPCQVVVCVGNPPYRRGMRDARVALNGFEAGAGGVHRKNLHNEYVYFWRWALRVAFEARRGPAVVCFVTAASYLRGPAFGGMRRAVRAALDELWLIDLEGDRRAARASANVFQIRTPVAIALGVRTGGTSSDTPALVHYARLDGTAAHKSAVLGVLTTLEDVTWQAADGEWAAPLVPRVPSEYHTWPALTELFPWQLSGAQLKRTWPIGATPEVLRTRWRHLLSLPLEERRAAFVQTRDRDLASSPPDLHDGTTHLPPLSALAADAACPEPVHYAYRAFDRQWVLPDARVGDFMRPTLWRVAGPRQVFLTSMLTNVLGPGPAAVATCHAPDLDHFRGSFGARGVIPLWLDADATRPNVSMAWLDTLGQRYGSTVEAGELMAYCYAVLSAPSYTRHFADELRTPGPRVPLPHDAATFQRGAMLGSRLLALHTYHDVPRGAARLMDPIGEPYPTRYGYDAARERVWLGRGSLGPVSPGVWAFSVSGYPVVNGWLRRRQPRRGRSPLDAIGPAAWDAVLTGELLELIWLVEATVTLGPDLDALLETAAASRPAHTG